MVDKGASQVSWVLGEFRGASRDKTPDLGMEGEGSKTSEGLEVERTSTAAFEIYYNNDNHDS